jgi:hypothetical protein
MKYFKDQNNEIFGFLLDGSQDELIKEGMTEIIGLELDKLINPEKYLSNEDKVLILRQRLPKLSKRQFSLYLYDNDVYDQVMAAITTNPRFKIEFDTVADIERLSPTVSDMSILLGWTDEKIDEMWEQAMLL